MAEFVRVGGLLVPRHVYERALHEKRMGYEIDPSRLGVALNREMRRKLEKQARRQRAKLKRRKDGTPVMEHEVPIVMRRPIGKREALDRVTDDLMRAMAEHTHPGTVVTLKSVLDRAEAEIVERAWKNGHPIPRELVRRALQEINRRGDARRADTRRK